MFGELSVVSVWILALCSTVYGGVIYSSAYAPACIEDGRQYEVGRNWTCADNPCSLNECVRDENGNIVITRGSCMAVGDIPAGCQLQQDLHEPFPRCCGSIICQPTTCTEDGRQYYVGQKWSSAANPCSLNECIRDENGNLAIKRGSCRLTSPSPGCFLTDYDYSKEFPHCCPIQRCVKISDTCSYKGRQYRVGERFTPGDEPCSVYTCSRSDRGGTCINGEICALPPTRPGCNISDIDTTKPYPECCPVVTCAVGWSGSSALPGV